MAFADLRKLSEPEFTVALRAKPGNLVITDEAAVPGAYWIPQPAKLDKQGLKAALRAGQAVPGALLDTAGTIVSVRTK